MKKILRNFFLTTAMLATSWGLAANVNLDNFFEAASKVKSGSLLQADLDKDTVDAFKTRYAADATRLELDSCHAVYKLLGTLAAQVELGFQSLAQTVLQSYETNKGLLSELTGYTWSTTEVANHKNAEVVRVLQELSWLQTNKALVNTPEGMLKGSQEPVDRSLHRLFMPFRHQPFWMQLL